MEPHEPEPAPGEDRSLALALVNTRVTGSRGVFERLPDAEALTRWLQRHRVDAPAPATGPDLDRFTRLRGDARVVLDSVQEQVEPPADVLTRVNATAGEVAVRPVLRPGPAALEVEWRPVPGPDGRSAATAAVARDLVVFAASDDARRVRTCAADDCDRMFVQDHGRRIWCSPGCGNRTRVQRHARRARAGRAAGSTGP